MPLQDLSLSRYRTPVPVPPPAPAVRPPSAVPGDYSGPLIEPPALTWPCSGPTPLGYAYNNDVILEAAIVGAYDTLLPIAGGTIEGDLTVAGGFTVADPIAGAVVLPTTPQNVHSVIGYFTADITPVSGNRGLHIQRHAGDSNPIGITLEQDNGALWDTACIDGGTTDLILAYAHQTGLPGAHIRLSQVSAANGGVKMVIGGEAVTSPLGNSCMLTVVPPAGATTPVGGIGVRGLAPTGLDSVINRYIVCSPADGTAQANSFVLGQVGNTLASDLLLLFSGDISPNSVTGDPYISTAVGFGFGIYCSPVSGASVLFSTPHGDNQFPRIAFSWACTQAGVAQCSFFGAQTVSRRTLTAAATDPATTMALANSIRTALIQLGLCQ